MMNQENQRDYEDAQLHVPHDEMETLVLDEPSDGKSLSGHIQPSQSVSVFDNPLSVSPSPIKSAQSPKSHFNAFLDPPSYAEAVFTSFDSSSNGHENADLSSSSNPSNSDYLYISVSDPQKEQELTNSLVPGGSTYYTYLITTRTNLPEYGGPGSEFSVRRRFRDVVTLSERLSESYRGYFIPMRPDKNSVESQVMQKQEFVEQRRLALEKYLRNLAAHPVIRTSEELRVFLEVKGCPFPSQVLQQGAQDASQVEEEAPKAPQAQATKDEAAIQVGCDLSLCGPLCLSLGSATASTSAADPS